MKAEIVIKTDDGLIVSAKVLKLEPIFGAHLNEVEVFDEEGRFLKGFYFHPVFQFQVKKDEK